MKNENLKYMKRLQDKINKKLSFKNLSNEDLHTLNFYYDTLFYFDQYENAEKYEKELKKYELELQEEVDKIDL